MIKLIKKLFSKNNEDKLQNETESKLVCDHKYEYKTWLQDTKYFPHSNSPFYKEIVFRCSKCGEHRSLYTFEISREFHNLTRKDIEVGHDDFCFEIPRVNFCGNEAFEIYKKYLKEGIDLTDVNYDKRTF